LTATDPLRQFDEVRPMVEGLVGHTAGTDTTLKVTDCPTLANKIRSRLNRSSWAAQTFVLAKLGVIQPQTDLLKEYVDGLIQYEQGMYDPSSKTIYFSPGPNPLSNRLALVKALSEAIDDQQYGLLEKRAHTADSDAFTALTAVVEGSSANVVTRFALSLEAVAQPSSASQQPAAAPTATKVMEPYIFRLLSLPLTGQWLLARGNPDAIYNAPDSAWKSSTFTGHLSRMNDIFHVITSQTVDAGVGTVQLSSIPALESRGWNQIDRESFGAYNTASIAGILNGDVNSPDSVSSNLQQSLALLYDEYAPYADSATADSFYLGTTRLGEQLFSDEFVVYRKNEQMVALWMSAWSTTAAADEFARLISTKVSATLVQNQHYVLVSLMNSTVPPLSGSDLTAILATGRGGDR
jgi:hypothetical protein